jgi:hypothetical protein
MEGRWNVWNPWYLLPEDKLGRWNASFVVMLFHPTRIKCYSISVVDMMAVGELELQRSVFKGTSTGESLICPM